MQSQPDDLIGTLVAERYRVKEQLGRGGMGTVYLAEHEAIRKKVALKVLHPQYSAKPDLVERFQREAISASRVKHVNVLEVFDFGQLPNGCFYLAMEFLEGHDLADELEKCKVLSAERTLGIAKQVCRALSAAHARGVVHRDLKPENVFLSRSVDGEEIVKIVDFGIAQLRTPDEAAKSQPSRRRLTRTGMIFGTPEYMSPEQAQGARSDHRVDVYAVGVMLYEMLTGAVPFTGDTFLGVLQAHLHQTLRPMREMYSQVSVSKELEGVVARALAKDVAQRFDSMGALAAALWETPEGRAMRESVLPPPGPALDRISSVPTASHPSQPTSVQFDKASASERGTADTVPEAANKPRSPKAATAVTALGETTPSPPVTSASSSRVGVIALSVGAVVIAAGATALFWIRSPDAKPTPATAELSASTAPPAPSATETPSIAPAPPQPPAPDDDKVSLDVQTVPQGATVFMNGAQVCDKAPCEVRVTRDETVELRAELDGKSASRKVLAQRDQTVSLELKKKGGVAPRKMCSAEVMRDGIKVFIDVPCKQ